MRTAHTGSSSRRDNAVPRRDAIKGLAWSVPVIAATAAVPAATASPGTLALAFTATSYEGRECGVEGISLHATLGGAPATGIAVTVTCSAPLTFSDGTRSFVGSTDSVGDLRIPPVSGNAPATGALLATSGPAQASSTVTTRQNLGLSLVQDASVVEESIAVPAGSMSIGAGYFLTPDGELILNGVSLATSVTSGAGYWYHGRPSANVMQAGMATYYSGSTVALTAPAVPADATAHAGGYFLSNAGALYFGDIIAEGVAKVAGFMQDDTPHASAVVGGVAQLFVNAATVSTHPAVPASATPVGADYYLTPSGELYFGDALITTGVTGAAGYTPPGISGAPHAAVVLGTSAVVYESATLVAPLPAVPSGTEPHAGGYFLFPDGGLSKMGAPVLLGTTPVKDAAHVYAYADDGRDNAVVTRHLPCPAA